MRASLNSLRRTPMLLAAASVLLIGGCTYLTNRTRTMPDKSALVGTWVLDEATLRNANQNRNHAGSATRIIFHDDDRAEIFQVPDARRNLVTDSGTWKLVPGGDLWDIDIKCSRYFIMSYLFGQRPPYRLNITYGDSDSPSTVIDLYFVKTE